MSAIQTKSAPVVSLPLSEDAAHKLLTLLATTSQENAVWVQKDPWDDGPDCFDELLEARQLIEFCDELAVQLADRLTAVGLL